MRSMRKTITTACFVTAVCLVVPTLAADPPKAAAESTAQMPGNLADFWIFWPKAGHEAQFEAAVKAHLAWRKQAREGWTWNAYQPTVGTDLTYYVYRSGEHHWADFDAEQAWDEANKASDEFNRTVAPHIERYEHIFEEVDESVSHWEMSPDYRYVWVESSKLKAGASGAMREAAAGIHKALQAGGWKSSYSISRQIGGGGGFTLVFPYKSYAEMQEPTPGFMEVLAKGSGSMEAAQALIAKFDSAVEETQTTIYVARPDLSTP